MQSTGLVFMAATFLHNQSNEASEDNFSFPPTLPGTFPFQQKVPFYLLGEALFGAISLATPSWADVHPT